MDYLAELFPNLRYAAYLNHAAVSPLNARSQAAMTDLIQRYAEQGVKAVPEGGAVREKLRSGLGRLIHADPKDIAILGSTSEGLLTVAMEYPWRQGDRLVLLDGEFPSNVVPWQVAADHYGLEIIRLHPEDLRNRSERFREAMAARPKLLAVSWVQFQTGLTIPLEDLAQIRREYGLHVALDAIQGLGPLTLDLTRTPFDFLACGGQKWLLATEGVAFLYVNPAIMPNMRPMRASWLSVEDPLSFLFNGGGLMGPDRPIRSEIRRYEMATGNMVGMAALGAGVDLILEVGTETVSERVRERAHRCHDGLLSLGIQLTLERVEAGIVSFRPPSHHLNPLAESLEHQGIIVATPDGYLRASPHFYNSLDQVDLFLDGVKDYLKRHDWRGETQA